MLAHSVEEELHNLDCKTFVLDGDNIRQGLSSNLTLSDNDRKENIKIIGELAKLLLLQSDFIEIYCKASLETYESRDVKRLCECPRAGQIKNYTGIDSPYEAPKNLELVINTESESL